jgi:hypothetical protein
MPQRITLERTNSTWVVWDHYDGEPCRVGDAPTLSLALDLIRDYIRSLNLDLHTQNPDVRTASSQLAETDATVRHITD